MPQIVTTIDIDAPPAVVWNVLTDASRFDEWNPLLKLLRGEFREGALIVAKIDADGIPFAFDARVNRCEPNRVLSWVGPSQRIVHGVVSGEHSFELVDLGQGRTRLVHAERFDGLLMRIEPLWAFLEKKLQVLYPRFDRAIKARAESRAR